MILSPLIEESYLKAPAYCDSIGSDVGTLPDGVGILDIDNALLSPGILQAIAVDPSTRDAIDRCYRDFESFTPTGSLPLPPLPPPFLLTLPTLISYIDTVYFVYV